jgi:hypothetical protein
MSPEEAAAHYIDDSPLTPADMAAGIRFAAAHGLLAEPTCPCSWCQTSAERDRYHAVLQAIIAKLETADLHRREQGCSYHQRCRYCDTCDSVGDMVDAVLKPERQAAQEPP